MHLLPSFSKFSWGTNGRELGNEWCLVPIIRCELEPHKVLAIYCKQSTLYLVKVSKLIVRCNSSSEWEMFMDFQFSGHDSFHPKKFPMWLKSIAPPWANPFPSLVRTQIGTLANQIHTTGHSWSKVYVYYTLYRLRKLSVWFQAAGHI